MYKLDNHAYYIAMIIFYHDIHFAIPSVNESL